MISQQKYAVIICRYCKQPKITETRHKTTKCPRCGKTLPLSKTVFIHQTNNLSEAQQVIGQINAAKADKLDEFKTFVKQSRKD